jgi:asparagine synthetase B (glutamine-hydrolysing)
MLRNDWCGSQPTFYIGSSQLEIGSHLPLTIDKSVDWIGLTFFLRMGYCAFGRTPFNDIHFLQANQRLENGILYDRNIQYLTDLKRSAKVSVDHVLKLLSTWIKRLEDSSNSKIIIPLSGGLDSRLLVSMIEDKSRIIAFSYGQSWNQAKSNEVRIAQELSKKLKFEWHHLNLGDFSRFTKEWLQKWGAASHAHGMYQMSFYSQISKIVPQDSIVLSGVIGDLLAGSLKDVELQKPTDLMKLGLSRQMNAEIVRDRFKIGVKDNVLETELSDKFDQLGSLLEEKAVKDLLVIQNKKMLLRYLMEVPRWYGLQTYSPFIDEEIGTSMLRLDPSERFERKWQHDLFRSIGLSDQHLSSRGLYYNTLNYKEIASKKVDYELLDNMSIFNNGEEIRRAIVSSLNALSTWYLKIFTIASQTRFFHWPGRVLLRLFKKRFNTGLSMYYSYLTLIPLTYKGEIFDNN